ncbi:MAG: DUF4114 domain-containing protein [Cyanobacteria bacterium J06643_4]
MFNAETNSFCEDTIVHSNSVSRLNSFLPTATDLLNLPFNQNYSGQSLPVEQPLDFSAIASTVASISPHWTNNNSLSPVEQLQEDLLLTGGQASRAFTHDNLQPAWERAIAHLSSIDTTAPQLQNTLGNRWNTANLERAIAPLITNTSSLTIELAATSVLQAKGAYASENNTLYLAEDWANTQDIDAIVDVLLEEIGHYLDDALYSPTSGEAADTAGDEGAIFSALIQGETLSETAIARLKEENDRGNIVLNQQTISVERASLDQAALNSAVGTFVVDANGQIEIDFLFDGGEYAGELAVFSLDGMGGLETAAFAKEAARRALNGGNQGSIVISDKTEGAQFSGSLGERDRNQGTAASTKRLTFTPGSRVAIMLVSNGTIADVLSGGQTALFSIAAHNPGGHAQIAQAASNVFAMEDLQIGQGDADFNDIIFRVAGATGNVQPLQALAANGKNWLEDPTAQTFLQPTGALDPGNQNTGNNPGGNTGNSAGVLSAIGTNTPKFTPSSTQTEIEQSGAQKITIGTQTIYIGTEQATAINQDPILRSFDPVNPANNWTQDTLETSGTDGRGLGLLWSGSALYGIFSVDGAQNNGTDFRPAASNATQNWLKSYGSGGGPKIAVIAQLDPTTGALLKAAHLSAILSDGKTNSLSVTGATVKNNGNLVIQAQSFSSPRRPDGTALTKNPGNTAGSPFDYTIEITSDLATVISTNAPGWS